jgi:hypothetical protein
LSSGHCTFYPQYHYSSFYKSKAYEKNSLDYLVLTPEHLKGTWNKYLLAQMKEILKERYTTFIRIKDA